VVPRGVLVGVELLLAFVVIGVLVFSRAGLLAWFARSRERGDGPALIGGALCYALAVLAAIGLERMTSGGHLVRWIHAPLRALIGHALVIGGVFGLATRVVARLWPWRGESRYLAVASVVPLAIGLAWLAIGAAEVAWVWLVPAAAIALAPLVPRTSAPVRSTPLRALSAFAPRVVVVVSVLATALPIALVLDPHRLREAEWNGFLPVSVPLAATVGLFGIPVVAAVAWALRRRTHHGPMGTLVLGLGCGLLAIAGLVVALTAPAPCTPAEFVEFLLACERV
jgi:hypothetical protein